MVFHIKFIYFNLALHIMFLGQQTFHVLRLANSSYFITNKYFMLLQTANIQCFLYTANISYFTSFRRLVLIHWLINNLWLLILLIETSWPANCNNQWHELGSSLPIVMLPDIRFVSINQKEIKLKATILLFFNKKRTASTLPWRAQGRGGNMYISRMIGYDFHHFFPT